jgi:Uma2 family endonuclease
MRSGAAPGGEHAKMIPMSSPWWFEELPEFMTEAEYRDLSEQISRTIEIVHGHVIKCESPAPRHNRIARRLSSALESARSPSDPCLTIETDVDVILWRLPRFTFRRPDVVVYKCIDDPAGKPTAQETVMVVEVSSPTTAREDLLDKKAQYAAAGIPLYLVIVLDDKYDIWEVREFHLDAAASAYRLHAVHRSVLDLEQPVRLTLPISDLVTA